ncbi:MAG: GDP-mannose 4,6-dehydratase [Acidobacteriota bacterium]|nr:GDP-mannose 4,6-dehydratase [Acidobacteriota bacterium]
MGKRTYLLTGAAGFIGSHVADRLVERGDRVIGLDNFDDFYDVQIKRDNLAGVAAHESFRLVEGDIRDAALVRQLLSAEKVDAVVHLAARAGVRPSVENPELYADVNVRGTATLLQAVAVARVPRVIYASSSSVYGGNEKLPFSEDDRVDEPISPYAATKKATELLAHTYHHLYGFDAIGLRFFTVYGPRQRPEMAIHHFTRLIDAEQPIQMFGDGSSRRDYTYVEDCVDGVMAAIDRARGSRIYNLGGSITTSLSELIQMIGRALGRTPRIEERPLQPGDVPATFADVTRARTELGFEPQVDVEQGIVRFISWYHSQRSKSGREV